MDFINNHMNKHVPVAYNRSVLDLRALTDYNEALGSTNAFRSFICLFVHDMHTGAEFSTSLQYDLHDPETKIH